MISITACGAPVKALEIFSEAFGSITEMVLRIAQLVDNSWCDFCKIQKIIENMMENESITIPMIMQIGPTIFPYKERVN